MVREQHDVALEACGPWITAVDEQQLAALDVLGHDRQRTASPAPALARRHGVYIRGLVEQVGAHVGQVLERRGLIGRDIESAWLATDFVAGKPVGINHTIGRRLTLASGISDGDFEMLEYTTSAPGLQLGLLSHHDNGEREYAYDRRSSVGRVERRLDEAAQRGWVILSMKDDSRRVYDADRK